MKLKNIKLEWYVLNHDFNSDKIIKYNIFNCIDIKDIASEIKAGKIYDYVSLKDRLDRKFRYMYWCRAEYEILVGGLHTRVEPTKIDIYYQIQMNLDLITKYLVKELEIEF